MGNGPGGHQGKQRKKVFFFEKKKQKTFGIGVQLHPFKHKQVYCPKK
jgi:hypothetical protein